MEQLRWGVVGTGSIAGSFVKDLALLTDAVTVAVGSRSQASADAFGERHGIPNRHASYEGLVNDPDVDAVYVATPHPGHHHATLLAVDAGKAVLCEKPFAMDAVEAAGMVAAARRRGTFLMEAMWTRFLPHMVRLRELLADGALGDVRVVSADLAYAFAFDPSHRLYARELGGGSLLDLGVYPVSFASMVLGRPTRVAAVSHPTTTGVDATTSVLLDHDGGAQALVSCTLQAEGTNRAAVVGTEGRVEIDQTWIRPTSFTWYDRNGTVRERLDQPHEGGGLRHQAAEVARCVSAGLAESPVMPLDETMTVMATLDEIRAQIGLTYPA